MDRLSVLPPPLASGESFAPNNEDPIQDRLGSRGVSKLKGSFTLLSRGGFKGLKSFKSFGEALKNFKNLSECNDLCWGILDPSEATLELWSYPPQEDCARLAAQDLQIFSDSGAALSVPRRIGSLYLENLRSVDFNPHFRTIFMSIEGSPGWRLTAQKQDTFDRFKQTLERHNTLFSKENIPARALPDTKRTKTSKI